VEAKAADLPSNGHGGCDWAEGTLGGILDGLAVALGARRAAAFVRERTGRWRVAATHGLSAREARYLRARVSASPATFGYWRRVARGQPFFSGDAAAGAAWVRRLGFDAHLALPLLAGARDLLGSLALEMPAPSAEQVRLADAVAAVAATAIANAYTARAQAEEVARSRALLEIVREMNRGASLPELLVAICRKTVQAFGLQRATVFYYHPRRGAHVPFADHGTPAHVAERFVRMRYNLGNTPHVHDIAAGRTVVISRAGDLGFEDRQLLDTAELHALALLPLWAENHSRGTLAVGIAAEQEFTPEQIAGLEVVAHHVATAIAQARSLRASEKAARFRAAVSRLAVDLNAETSRARALQLLCMRGRDIFGASTGAMLLAAGEQLLAEVIDSEVPTPAERLSVRLASTDHPGVRAFVTGQVVLANEFPPDAPAAAAGFRSVLAIPVAGNDGIRGVLLLGDARRRHFDPRVADEASVLGALAAAALRNLDLMTRLYAANAELRQVSSAKDHFLANVSHDLRTPLNVIIGYGQLAREGTFGAPPPQLQEILGRMIGSAREQLTLVEDLLDLSRIELGTLSVKVTTVPLPPLFAEMEFALASMLHDRPVRGVVTAPPAEIAVSADRDRLRQILANLLGNAAKFTDAGTVELRAERDHDRVRISVRDTGIGVAPEDHDRIFEPFLQVEGARSRLGAGLGLAISRRLSTLMGGTLTVESVLGAGATFWLSLPAASSVGVSTGGRV
jgi:signal transduction histidine kinase